MPDDERVLPTVDAWDKMHKRIDEQEQNTQRNWNLIQELAQEILPKQLDRVEQKIEALELAIKNSPPNSHLKEQISELRNLVHANDHDRDLVDGIHYKKIAELREVLREFIKIIRYEDIIDEEQKDWLLKKLSGEIEVVRSAVMPQALPEPLQKSSVSTDSKPDSFTYEQVKILDECGLVKHEKPEEPKCDDGSPLFPDIRDKFYSKKLGLEKEPTDDRPFTIYCSKCGEHLGENVFMVQKADLEDWRDSLTYFDNKKEVIREIKKYLEEHHE